MCGRASHSARSVALAAEALNAHIRSNANSPTKPQYKSTASAQQISVMASISLEDLTTNTNISPGSSAHVFYRNITTNSIECSSMKWGLPSTQNKLLFNARSETIYDKPTFHPLISKRQTIIWAVDGWYEWKDKQPYYVCRKDGAPILLAGLWKEGNERTFTILTMDAYPSLEKLHPRQPVILWDYDMAITWLREQNCNVLNNISSTLEETLQFYPVTKRMSDGKYHGEDCTKEIKLSNIMSFFDKSGDNRDVLETHIPRNSIPVEKEVVSEQKQTNGHGSKAKHSNKDSKKRFSTELPETKIQVTNEAMGELAEWACRTCTFIHTGKSIKFLSCEVCGAKRDVQGAAGIKRESDGSTSKNERNDTTSRAWGSLCSPKSSKRRKA